MSLDYNDLGACEICDHCMGYYPDQFYCAFRNDNFGNISDPQDCEDFDYADDDDDEDDEDDDDEDDDYVDDDS